MIDVITILDAEVQDFNWKLLEKTYKSETSKIPESIKQTMLIQSQKEPCKWRIVTQWRSQEELDQMRLSEEMPLAVRIFKAAGATPSLEIWDLQVHRLGL